MLAAEVQSDTLIVLICLLHRLSLRPPPRMLTNGFLPQHLT